jgi:hypothetical protein
VLLLHVISSKLFRADGHDVHRGYGTDGIPGGSSDNAPAWRGRPPHSRPHARWNSATDRVWVG